MLESLRAASWKARLLNGALIVLFFSALSGCGIAFLGVLQEGTDRTNSIWQFYWNGVVTSANQFVRYSELDSDVGRSCAKGGQALVGIEVAAMLAIVIAYALCIIRTLGVHVARLQPAVRFLAVEAGLTVLAAALQLMACVAWGATCYHASAQMSVMEDMTPTGYVWIVLCFGFLCANIAAYVLIHADPACALGSVYGGELTGQDGNEHFVPEQTPDESPR